MPEQQKLISSGELAKIFGTSERYVQKLVQNGIITAQIQKRGSGIMYRYNLYSVVKEYIDYSREQQKPKGNLDEQKLYEDVRYRRAKADLMELEQQEVEGKMHRSEDVEDVMTDLVLTVRSALMALPGRLGVDLADLTTKEECSEVVKKAIYEVLEDLSNYKYDPAIFVEKARNRKGWESLADEETNE